MARAGKDTGMLRAPWEWLVEMGTPQNTKCRVTTSSTSSNWGHLDKRTESENSTDACAVYTASWFIRAKGWEHSKAAIGWNTQANPALATSLNLKHEVSTDVCLGMNVPWKQAKRSEWPFKDLLHDSPCVPTATKPTEMESRIEVERLGCWGK